MMKIIMDGDKIIPDERVDDICERISWLKCEHRRAIHARGTGQDQSRSPLPLPELERLIEKPDTVVSIQTKFYLQKSGFMDVHGNIPNDVRAVYSAVAYDEIFLSASYKRTLKQFFETDHGAMAPHDLTKLIKSFGARRAADREKYPNNELILLERHKTTLRPDPMYPFRAQWGTKAIKADLPFMRFPGLGT